MNKPKNPTTELILCVLLGWAGGHKFYNKKIGAGILYLLTYGLFGIGWILDLVILTVRVIKSISFTRNATETNAPVEVIAQSTPVLPAADSVASIEAHPNDAPIESGPKLKTYKITGMQYYLSNIMNLASENIDYDKTKQDLIDCGLTNAKVWKYEFRPICVNLVPEPTNPNDKNAIMVYVDGEHVGYIKSGSCAHLLKVISEGRIADIKCTMGGGPYKYVKEDYDYEKDKTTYTMDRSSSPYFVHLNISEKSLEA